MKKAKKKSLKNYTYYEFLVLFTCCSKELQEEMLVELRKAKCPTRILKKDVPSDFNTLSYGMLDDLNNASASVDPALECIKVLLQIEPDQALRLSVCTVFGFANFCEREISRINDIFKSIKTNYSSEEIAAGIKELNFGSFGILDWYARRMGITNQNEVREVAWIRIFNCMKNDNETNAYERRLREQYQKKRRRNGRG